MGKNVAMAGQGDNVGLNVKGLPKDNMPRVGDVVIGNTDSTLTRTASFDVAVKVTALQWKMGKKTGGQKVQDPVDIEAGEMGACRFEPQQPFVVDAFKSCEGLGRVAIMEGNSVVMLGKASATEPFI